MALFTVLSDASPDMNSLEHSNYISSLRAGEELAAVAPCYIGSDGKVYQSVSTQCTIANLPDFVGFTPKVVASGMPVTLFGKGARFNYAAEMTPGSYLWVSDTKGKLSDAKVASADTPVAVAVSANDIVVIK